MLFVLKRAFTYFTLLSCVLAASITWRVVSPEMSSFDVSLEYLSLFQPASLRNSESFDLSKSAMVFNELKFIETKPILPRIATTAPKKNVAAKTEAVRIAYFVTTHVAKEILPFSEPITLRPVYLEHRLPQNLISLYNDFVAPAPTMIAADVKTDEVSTKLAASEEPEFFEYPVKEAAKPVEAKVAAVAEETTIEEKQAEVRAQEKETVAAVVEEESLEELVTYDYSSKTEAVKPQVVKQEAAKQVAPVSTGTLIPQVTNVQAVYNQPAMQQAVASPTVPKVSAVTTQTPKAQDKAEEKQSEVNAFLAPQPKTYPVSLSIQGVATDLKGSKETQGFEVRVLDDYSASYEDYGSGEVVLKDELSTSKMTRTISLLKHGYTPTTTDAILEEGETSMGVPMIQSDVFNELIAPYEGKGPVGALLVELDDKTEYAQVDVPFGAVIKLDGDLKTTESEDFRYQLFVGLKPGNVLLSYKIGKSAVSKIVHVHEAELTYDTNFFEGSSTVKLALMEEDLLSKNGTPLIIGAELVKQFATDKTSQKLNDHTYKLNFENSLLGSRKYVELNHQREPVFLGIKNRHKVYVPSESFMRYILSSFEGQGMANRCVIQVNLSKKVSGVEVGTESAGQSLMTQTQYLDRDGKFYDSASEKTRKVIILGENQGSDEDSSDGKVNLKVTYMDGSVEYLGSYCSSNTYLVEQL